MGNPLEQKAGLERPAPVAGFRMGYMSLLAALIGAGAGLIAFILYDLIGLFTNLSYYHEWSFHCPGQEKHTMCEREVQIANPGG